MTAIELPAWIAAHDARPGDVVEFPHGRVRGEIETVEFGGGRDGDGRPCRMIFLTVWVHGNGTEHRREGKQFPGSQLLLLARNERKGAPQ